jgi:hypothetical protein
MPKKHKGKPQITGQFQDEKGNRLWQALDGGWVTEFWARVKSEAIILSTLAVEVPCWTMLEIRHDAEDAFTKFFERESKHKDVPLRYIVIRTRSSTGANDDDSWFFIHDLGIDDKTTAYYSGIKPEVITPEELEDVMKLLFCVDMHPTVPRTRRWSASKVMRHDLALNRMRYLIHLAREGQDHEITHPLPLHVTFAERLARYIAHDRPLTYNLKPAAVSPLIQETQELSWDEALDVMKELLRIKRHWRKVGFYKGLPSAGAKIDRATGLYIVRESKLSALSIRLKPLTEAELRWETIPQPEDEEGYIE